MVQVIEGKIIWKWSEGKQKLLRVSGSFELSRVRVSEGKITVNVWRKSRGNRFSFELARGSSYRESTAFIISEAANLNTGWLRKSHNKRRKDSNWSGSADKTCFPAFQKPNPNKKTYAQLFEDEWCTCKLSLKWRRLKKSKHYSFELENTVSKNGLFGMEVIFERKFLKIYAAFQKPTCGKWKKGLFSNRICFNFENQLSRTRGCVPKWRVSSKRAIVLGPRVNNNCCQE